METMTDQEALAAEWNPTGPIVTFTAEAYIDADGVVRTRAAWSPDGFDTDPTTAKTAFALVDYLIEAFSIVDAVDT